LEDVDLGKIGARHLGKLNDKSSDIIIQ